MTAEKRNLFKTDDNGHSVFAGSYFSAEYWDRSTKKRQLVGRLVSLAHVRDEKTGEQGVMLEYRALKDGPEREELPCTEDIHMGPFDSVASIRAKVELPKDAPGWLREFFPEGDFDSAPAFHLFGDGPERREAVLRFHLAPTPDSTAKAQAERLLTGRG